LRSRIKAQQQRARQAIEQLCEDSADEITKNRAMPDLRGGQIADAPAIRSIFLHLVSKPQHNP